ncbi:hypothetical protein QBC41DRAFT_337767 [Cercophora samala]|uniref:Uncharacterized protein n=1 Tax=Cercophora samala TaxID=330535 RepID=A0AA39ZC18_9PEZI|nr:hypothetical protein QBC41DRAFT_337767 [Cercophora samala]
MPPQDITNQAQPRVPPAGTTTVPPAGTTTVPPAGTTTVPPAGTTTARPAGTGTTTSLPLRPKKRTWDTASLASGPANHKRQQPYPLRSRGLDAPVRSEIQLPSLAPISAKKFIAAEKLKNPDGSLDDETREFLQRDDVKQLAPAPAEYRVQFKRHANIYLEDRAHTLGWMVKDEAPNSYIARIAGNIEHLEAYMASMLVKLDKVNSGNGPGAILKIRTEIMPSRIAESERSFALSNSWFVPPCSICDSEVHTAKHCILPSTRTGASFRMCAICEVARDHCLDQCPKLASTRLEALLEKLWRQNMPQFLSGRLAWHDCLPYRYGFIGKTEKEIVDLVKQLQEDGENPFYPWTFQFGREIAAIEPDDCLSTYKGIHPVNYQHEIHPARKLPMDPYHPFDNLAELVTTWRETVVNPTEYEEDTHFARDRLVPSIVKNKLRDNLSEAITYLLPVFRKQVKQILNQRGALTRARHPRESSETPESDWMLHNDLPVNRTWPKPAGRPQIRIITRGLLDFHWDGVLGHEVLAVRQRPEEEVYAFNKASVFYWVHTWVDELIQHQTINGRSWRRTLKTDGPHGAIQRLFEFFHEEYHRQGLPTAKAPETVPDDQNFLILPPDFNFGTTEDTTMADAEPAGRGTETVSNQAGPSQPAGPVEMDEIDYD